MVTIPAQQSDRPHSWYALDIDVQPEAREAVEYALMEAGALGTETTEDNNRVTAYFENLPPEQSIKTELLEALRIYSLPPSSIGDPVFRKVENQDWLAEWKKGWQPVPVGERFIVAPPWSEIADAQDRIVIRIEPGMAFGTGTHETTRLCLEAIEKHFNGRSFLDVGTGTGILAIAAAKLIPDATISACDTDIDAVAIARENARLNGVADRILFNEGTITEAVASSDCVCANLTAPIIVELLPLLLGATCGRLICSGILLTQVASVLEALLELGVAAPLEITSSGEWACIVV